MYIYIREKPHVRVHEVLSYGTLILHLAFFYLFLLSFFIDTQKFTLTYFYRYLINLSLIA